MSEVLIVWIVSLFQVLIAFGLLNVWLVRSGRATKYRGGAAHNMKEEFAVYGLSVWFMYGIGFLKIVIACVMVLCVFMPYLMYPFGIIALGLLAVLMLGAVSMHIKVRDSFVKTLPALLMLAMAVITIYLTTLV